VCFVQSDISDVYMFQSQIPGNTVLIMNGSPLQRSDGGPNYSPTDTNFVYQFHIDNDGDSHEDITFQFLFGQRFGTVTATQNSGVVLPIGGIPVKIALVVFGPVTINDDRLNLFQANLNSLEYYRVRVQTGEDYDEPLENGPFLASFTDPSATTFIKPFDNVGTKTFPSYGDYADNFIYRPGNNAIFGNGVTSSSGVRIPGCNSAASLFVGPRRESFSIDLGRVFDLVNINPVDATNNRPSAEFNTLDCSTVLTFAIEVASSCLTGSGTDPVIAGWATVRTLEHVTKKSATFHVAGEQISRLGNPLINELFIGLPDKDLWSSEHPSRDAQFNVYLGYPTLPLLISVLFPGVVEPFTSASATPPITRFDILTLIHFGVPGLNRPVPPARKRDVESTSSSSSTGSSSDSSSSDSDDDDDDDDAAAPRRAVASDVLRLNTAVAATPIVDQDSLGILQGQPDGFPNGRRLGDDVVDIYLRVAVGQACSPAFIAFSADAIGLIGPALNNALNGNCFKLYGAGATAVTPAPATFSLPVTDRSPQTAIGFQETFPYLNAPIPGSDIADCWTLEGDIDAQFDGIDSDSNGASDHCTLLTNVPVSLRPLRSPSCVPEQ
jgi:hypothetical protein